MRLGLLAPSFVLVVACADSKPKAEGGEENGSSEPPRVWVDHRGECREDREYECKPGRTCNPPPPAKVDCPPGMREAWLKKIVVEPDGSCSHEGSPIFCPPELEPKPKPQ